MRLLSFFLGLLFFSCTYHEIIPDCNPNEQVFSNLVQPIIENNCISCHNESSNRPAVLDSYEGVIGALDNYLLKERVVNKSMPPYGFPEMSQEDIDIVKNWANCE